MVVYSKYKNHFNLFNELANTSLKKLPRKLSISQLNYELQTQVLSNLIYVNRLET